MDTAAVLGYFREELGCFGGDDFGDVAIFYL